MSISFTCLKQNSPLQRKVKSTDTYFYKVTISNHKKSISSQGKYKLSFVLMELFSRKKKKNFTSYSRRKRNILISGLLINKKPCKPSKITIPLNFQFLHL